MSLLLKECRWCGVSFVPARFNELYCSEGCREERRKEANRGKKLPTCYRKTNRLVDGVPTIPEIVASTIEYKNKTGRTISYGKMVNIMEKEGF
jgi:hypothetical protein